MAGTHVTPLNKLVQESSFRSVFMWLKGPYWYFFLPFTVAYLVLCRCVYNFRMHLQLFNKKLKCNEWSHCCYGSFVLVFFCSVFDSMNTSIYSNSVFTLHSKKNYLPNFTSAFWWQSKRKWLASLKLSQVFPVRGNRWEVAQKQFQNIFWVICVIFTKPHLPTFNS